MIIGDALSSSSLINSIMSPTSQSNTSAILRITNKVTSWFLWSLVNVAEDKSAFFSTLLYWFLVRQHDPQFFIARFHALTPRFIFRVQKPSSTLYCTFLVFTRTQAQMRENNRKFISFFAFLNQKQAQLTRNWPSRFRMATVYVASNAFLIRKAQNKMELSRKVLSRNARKGYRCAGLCHGGVGSFHAACPVGSFSRPCHPYSVSASIPNRRCRSGLLRQLQFLPLLLLRVPFPHSESLPTDFFIISSLHFETQLL